MEIDLNPPMGDILKAHKRKKNMFNKADMYQAEIKEERKD